MSNCKKGENMYAHRLGRVAAALALAAILAGCGSSSNAPGDLTTYITRVSSGDGAVMATLRAGSPPTGAGPAATALSPGVTIVGGSKMVSVSSSANFSAVIVAVEGIDGYYELTGLPSGTSTIIILTIGQTAPASFTLDLAAGAGGAYGALEMLPVELTSVGTGDVQVNVSWNVDSDVDLHVIDPSGEEVYYGNRAAASGGSLDLDSNAGCAIDGKRSENITWPTGGAPHGTYQVAVDYWNACSVTATDFVVTVNVKGQTPQIFHGSFVASDADGGGSGSGRPITTFTY